MFVALQSGEKYLVATGVAYAQESEVLHRAGVGVVDSGVDTMIVVDHDEVAHQAEFYPG